MPTSGRARTISTRSRTASWRSRSRSRRFARRWTRRWRRDTPHPCPPPQGGRGISELLQQAVDVVALEHGAVALAGALAQLLEDALGAFQRGVVDLARAHRAAVVDAAIVV